MDFSHLKKLEVKGKTAEYQIFQISGEPTLIMRPAVESNKPYFNSVLKKSRKKLKAAQVGSINPKMLKENRAEDRSLFPKYIIVDWKGIIDSKGNEVPFTEENCSQFLDALPDWIFDDIRLFAGKPENFAYETVDIEDKAKN